MVAGKRKRVDDQEYIPSKVRKEYSGQGIYRGPVGYYYKQKGWQNGTEFKVNDVHIAGLNGVYHGIGPHEVFGDGSLVNISEGAQQDQRVGRQIVVKKMFFRLSFLMEDEETPSNTGNIVRWCIVQDKQCNGQATNTNQIFVDQPGNSNPGPVSFRRLDETARFRIWHDETFLMMPTAGASDSNGTDYAKNVVFKEVYLNCNIPINFSGATGGISEIKSNNLLVCFFHDGGGDIKVKGIARIKYIG